MNKYYNKNGQINVGQLPKIVYKALGRQKAGGQAKHMHFGEKGGQPILEVDIGLEGRYRLEVETHEALHLVYPGLTEDMILRGGKYLSRVLWAMGYRLVDDLDLKGKE